MTEQRDKNFSRGITALVVGLVLAIAGALWAHFTGLSDLDNVGREMYPEVGSSFSSVSSCRSLEYS